MMAAKPKKMKVGGTTAHHNKSRLHEAKWWNRQSDDVINGIFFADESKMTFREHRNSAIDIEWTFRGQCQDANWYESPRHVCQVNLFLMMSRDGIEFYDIYNENMTKARYEDLLPQIGKVIEESDVDMSYYLHDNA